MTRLRRPTITPLAERNRLAVGAVGIATLIGLVVLTFSYDKLPLIKGTSNQSAFFAEAGGIKPGSDVRVSGMSVGRVSDIQLEGTKVRVDFTVRNGVDLQRFAPQPVDEALPPLKLNTPTPGEQR